MKEKVFVFERRQKELLDGLDYTAARLSALGKTVKENFPQMKYGAPFLWAMMDCQAAKPFYSFRDFLIDKLLNDAAARKYLDVGPGWNERIRGYTPTYILGNNHPLAGISDDVRLNRKIVEMECGETARYLRFFELDRDYLRMGAFDFDEEGTVKPVADASAKIGEFCTLYAETRGQSDFVKSLSRLRAAGEDLWRAYKDTNDNIPNHKYRRLFTQCANDYTPSEMRVMNTYGMEKFSIADEDTIPRALITFFVRTMDRPPKFYNRAGMMRIGSRDLHDITGGLIGNAEAEGRAVTFTEDKVPAPYPRILP